MKIINLTSDSQHRALVLATSALSRGGLVVYPTETCYGLGADATNTQAVQRLLQYKRRREGKPLSILVPSLEVAQKYVEVNDSAKKLYSRFLPGPMTVVSKSKGAVASGVASELGTLGIRISSHPFAMALSQMYGKPITATSANASWKKRPYSVEDILKPLTDKQKQLLDLIIDAGSLPKREASTVIDTTIVGTMVVRQGEIKIDTGQADITTRSEEETKNIARTLMLQHWNDLRQQGLLIALTGELGAGKTVFAKGVGAFLGIKDTITSPSYTLVNEYDYAREGITGTFYHLDPWRLESPAAMEQLGLSQMLKPNNVVVIEWANKFGELISAKHQPQVHMVTIGIKTIDDNTRKFRID